MSARRDWTHGSPALRRPHRAEMAAWQPAYVERRCEVFPWLVLAGLVAALAVILLPVVL